MLEYETELTILDNAVTVTIAYEVEGADRSVGINSRHIADWHIIAIDGETMGRDDPRIIQLWKTIDASPGENDRIIDALYDDFEWREE